MKIADILFILFVIAILFGLTAIRYRKQITGMIGLARALKDVKDMAGRGRVMSSEPTSSIPLVNCAKCGVWVPQDKAIKLKDCFYCSNCQ